MTLDELRKALAGFDLPGDTPIVMTKDAEGNDGASPLARVEEVMYEPLNTWSGELYLTERQRLAEDDPDGWDAAPPAAVPALMLGPTN